MIIYYTYIIIIHYTTIDRFHTLKNLLTVPILYELMIFTLSLSDKVITLLFI